MIKLNFSTDKYSLTISESVLTIFKAYIQDTKEKKESGGILFGEVDGCNIFIKKASIPNSYDKQTTYSFDRNREAAKVLIDYEFLNSSGKTIYLGEWHTHPQLEPKITKQDVLMIKNQLVMSKNANPFVITIIQGIKDLYVGLYDGKELVQMSSIK